jgi:hypothetical protein
MAYDKISDNYTLHATRIADNFVEPVDAVLVDNSIYVMEYGASGGTIWKVTLPKDTKAKPAAAKK